MNLLQNHTYLFSNALMGLQHVSSPTFQGLANTHQAPTTDKYSIANKPDTLAKFGSTMAGVQSNIFSTPVSARFSGAEKHSTSKAQKPPGDNDAYQGEANIG